MLRQHLAGRLIRRFIFAALFLLLPLPDHQVRAAPPTLARRDSFFGLHFDIQAQAKDNALGEDDTEQNVNNLLNAVRPDFVQWDVKGVYGYATYPTTVGYPAPGIVKDALPIWRKVTREHGVALYGYYSGLSDQQAVIHHPDWAQVNAAGARNTINLSTFSPYTTALMLPQMKEAANRYGLDGFWVDGQALTAGLDYSPWALNAWRNATGQGTAPTARGDPRWYTWKQFNRQQFLVHLKTWVDGIHSSAGVQVGSNWTFTANAPEPVSVGVDFLTGDFAHQDGLDVPRFEGRYMSSTGVPWDLMAWGFIHAGPSNYEVLNATAVEQALAPVLMQGGAVQVYHHPTRTGLVTDDIIQQTAAIAAFCRARQAVSFKSASVPQVALLASSQTYMDLCDTAFSPNGQWNKLLGVMHALLEAHYSVDILNETELQPRLQQYPLVVIPDAYTLPDGFLNALFNYVRTGGRLLVIGARSTPQFAPVLHVAFVGQPTVLPAFVHTSVGYANLDGYWQAVTAQTGAHPIQTRYPQLPPTKYPSEIAATLAHHGAGEAAGLYGPVAIDYFDRPTDAALRQEIIDAVTLLFPSPAVTLDGPPAVDLSLRHTQGGQLCVHLLNRAAMPTGPMHVHLKVPRKPVAVRFEPGAMPLRWSYSNGRISVAVPPLAIHGAVVVQ